MAGRAEQGAASRPLWCFYSQGDAAKSLCGYPLLRVTLRETAGCPAYSLRFESHGDAAKSLCGYPVLLVARRRRVAPPTPCSFLPPPVHLCSRLGRFISALVSLRSLCGRSSVGRRSACLTVSFTALTGTVGLASLLLSSSLTCSPSFVCVSNNAPACCYRCTPTTAPTGGSPTVHPLKNACLFPCLVLYHWQTRTSLWSSTSAGYRSLDTAAGRAVVAAFHAATLICRHADC